MSETVFVNEIHYDNAGVDTGEAIEIVGPAGADLAGWSVVLYNGNGGGTYSTPRLLLGVIPDQDNGFGTIAFTYPSNGLQNGGTASGPEPDGIALLNASGSVVQFLSYEGTFTATAGSAIGMASADIGVAESGSEPIGLSLQLAGSGTAYGDFIWAAPADDTFGQVNAGQSFGGEPPSPRPPALELAIYEIQGAGHTSAHVGEIIRTSGLVTAADSNGFYLQDPNGDGDAATSDAIFVFTGSSPAVAVGDAIALTAAVTEFRPGNNMDNLTISELTGATGITVLSTDNALPAITSIGIEGRIPSTGAIEDDGFAAFDPAADGIDFFESLEGMRVAVPNAVAISGTNGFGETWVLADQGVGSGPRNARGGLALAEGDDNPERIQIDTDSGVLAGFNLPVTTGDRLLGVEGVLSYDFGNYELVPTRPFTIQAGGLQPEVTTLEGDRQHLLIAEYNVENLDPGDGVRITELASQIVSNLKVPDILALQEIQDNNGPVNDAVTDASATYGALVDAIVATGGPRYAFADIPPADDTSGGEPGGNIRPGFLYDPSRVELLAGSLRQVTDADPSDGNAFTNSRIPLVADFRFGKDVVTVIDIHSSSKGGGTSLYGAVQPPINGSEDQRIAQAEAINAYIDVLLAADKQVKILVLGDANEFAWNESQRVLTGEVDGPKEQVLFDLAVEQKSEAERYSYVFDGNAQALDHSLVSHALLHRAEYDTVHLNSEFPDAERVSDHDPSVIRLALPPGADWHGIGS